MNAVRGKTEHEVGHAAMISCRGVPILHTPWDNWGALRRLDRIAGSKAVRL